MAWQVSSGIPSLDGLRRGALANRVAEETGTTVGGAIGYKVRFNDRTGPDCRIKLMTDGILLKELESDRKLRRYDTLIIDEAHERSLNIDLLLGVAQAVVAAAAGPPVDRHVGNH